MSTMKVFASALALAALGIAAAQAQELMPAPLTMEPAASARAPGSETPVAPSAVALPTLSNWITYTKPECCGPLGGNGPIGYELFLRMGTSLPVEGAVFGHILATGLEIEGGARSLFFNPAMDRDWSIDLSLNDIFNRGQRSDIRVPFGLVVATGTNPVTNLPTGVRVQRLLVSLRELNRTNVNAGVGHDWYLAGSARACDECRWRAGIDAGGRLGSAKAEFYEMGHRTDTIGGVYVGLHTELEIPRGCCTFSVGFRAEWDYTWMDILQIQNNSDVQDVNFLLTLGVRF